MTYKVGIMGHTLIPILFYKKKHLYDFIIGNAENAGGSFGLAPEVARSIIERCSRERDLVKK